MIVEWSKYKRFFSFGCSFTAYMWPTWADIISKEVPNAEFYNCGKSGCGNQYISYKIAEFNNKFKFCATDLIMVMFSTYCREDRFTTEKGWICGGNIFNNVMYPDSWVREFADERGYLIRDAAIIDMTMKYLENIPATHYAMLSVPFVTNADSCDSTSVSPDDIKAVYENTFNKFKPSMFELELRDSWKELELDYQFKDGHPSSIRYFNYLKKLGFNLSESTEKYAKESSELLATIPNRKAVPLYFLDQDSNISKAMKIGFT